MIELRFAKLAAFAASALILCGKLGAQAPAPATAQLEEAAFRSAAAAVAPSVVMIETVGGLDTVGELLVGTGPSSGLIVSDDGYIVSSSFNFVHKPASIVVSPGDGKRYPARLVGRDETRKLVLLKIDAAEKLPVPTAAPEGETAVGQWSVAVGRTFDSAPNLSVGIVSAVHRIWGKAVQTDAKISSANYGGPLVDLRGRVLGVLVPLSPNQREDISGAEWYDSGIGFAVPLEHIQKILPRLKAGETLKPGLIGVRFQGKNVYADPPKIAKARAGAPAFEAGVRDGDRIVRVEGKPVEVQAQVMEQLHRRYAGDSVKVTVDRDGKSLDFEIRLVEKIDPYQRPFFGIHAEVAVGDAAAGGAKIDFVYPDSPSAKAGLRPGDVVAEFGGKRITSRDELRAAAAIVDLKSSAKLEVLRDGAKQSLELSPTTEPEAVPGNFPLGEAPAEKPTSAAVKIKVPEFENEADLFTPTGYDEAVPYPLVVLFHPRGGFADKTVPDRWREACNRGKFLLLVPRATGGNWTPQALEFVKKSIDRAAGDYHVDPTRVVAVGYEEGASIALRAAAQYRDRIRGLAVFNAPALVLTVEADPAEPLAIYASATNAKAKKTLDAATGPLREQKLPVTLRTLRPDADDWDDAAREELARWIASLDRV